MKSIKKTARVAGVLYLLITILASFSVYVKSTLIVPGDAATTASNIISSEMLFRLSFVSDLIHQTLQIFLVLLLYKLLNPVGKNQAILMAVLGLIGIPIAMLNILNQVAVLQLLGGAEYMAAFTENQLHAMMVFFLDLLDYGFYIIFIPWGLWLFPMGYLIFKSGYIPKIIGILLMIACFGYLMDFVTLFLLPEFIEIRFFTFIGEPVLTLWLLIKGVNVEKWEKYNREAI